MKILAVSDKVIDALYSPQLVDLYGDVDMIVGCGDLPYYYLEYMTTILPIPVAYVHGNHDGTQFTADGRTVLYPEGCVGLDDRSVMINGLIFVGLGGSIRYKPGARYQYSEGEMRSRIFSLIPRLLFNKFRYGRYLDVLVAHSPPFGIHDGADRPHIGFKGFLSFMSRFKPRFLLHGHKHRHRRDISEITIFEETEVINVYPKFLLDTESNSREDNDQ